MLIEFTSDRKKAPLFAVSVSKISRDTYVKTGEVMSHARHDVMVRQTRKTGNVLLVVSKIKALRPIPLRLPSSKPSSKSPQYKQVDHYRVNNYSDSYMLHDTDYPFPIRILAFFKVPYSVLIRILTTFIE